MNFEMLAKKHGVTEDIVHKAFENAVEVALCKYLSVGSVMVDLEEKTVLVIFRVPFDMDYREALVFDNAILQADPLCVLFDLKSFPPPLVKRIRDFFVTNLFDLKDCYDYGIWQPKVHRVVEGLVLNNYDTHIEIETNGHTAFMDKKKWVPQEAEFYRPGQLMHFFVDSLTRDPFRIHLSRTGVLLPAMLLKHHLPWHNFACKKRYVGQKSWIFTDAPLDYKFSEMRDKVSAELYGEILEVRKFPS